MKTKVVQHVPRIIFNVFKFSGSQRLSDFQTFFWKNLPSSPTIIAFIQTCSRLARHPTEGGLKLNDSGTSLYNNTK